MKTLPTPQELAKTPKFVKTQNIPLIVDDDVLIYFKREAKRLGTSYQRLVSNLLTFYVDEQTATRARSLKK